MLFFFKIIFEKKNFNLYFKIKLFKYLAGVLLEPQGSQRCDLSQFLEKFLFKI